MNHDMRHPAEGTSPWMRWRIAQRLLAVLYGFANGAGGDRHLNVSKNAECDEHMAMEMRYD